MCTELNLCLVLVNKFVGGVGGGLRVVMVLGVLAVGGVQILEVKQKFRF